MCVFVCVRVRVCVCVRLVVFRRALTCVCLQVSGIVKNVVVVGGVFLFWLCVGCCVRAHVCVGVRVFCRFGARGWALACALAGFWCFVCAAVACFCFGFSVFVGCVWIVVFWLSLLRWLLFPLWSFLLRFPCHR